MRFKARLRRVIDGDTLELGIDLGFYIFTVQKVRLKGIDTPEIFKPNDQRELGYAAKAFVEEALQDKNIEIETYKTGKYGRWLCDVYYDDKNLADELRREGYVKRK